MKEPLRSLHSIFDMKINYELKINDWMIFYKKQLREHNYFFKLHIYIIALLLAFIVRWLYGGSHTITTIYGVVTSYTDTKYWLDIIYNFLGLLFIMRIMNRTTEKIQR